MKFKNKNLLTILFVIIISSGTIGILSTLKSINLDAEVRLSPNELYTSTSDSPIDINGNDDLSVYPGNGSKNNPYIIEDLIIDLSGSPGDHGINISNTDAYLEIRNCTIRNATGGIHLYNSSNVNISDTLLEHNELGIFLKYSNDNIISDNECYYNQFAILLNFNNDNNTISKNKCFNNKQNGIVLSFSDDNNTISNNNCFNNSNGGIVAQFSDYNDILNNNCSNSFYGIVSASSNGTRIMRNNCSDNLFGILGYYLDDNNSISRNKCFNNQNGIKLRFSNNTIISNNTCNNNSEYGISLSSSSENNTLFLNYFIENNINAIDNGTGNEWNNTEIGNYWANYTGSDPDNNGIGNIPYEFIMGTSHSEDQKPLYDAPNWKPIPEDININEKEGLSQEFNATYFLSISYSVNDTINFEINSNGLLTNRTILEVNIYHIELNASFGTFVNSTNIKITVQDITVPTWNSVPFNLTMELGSNLYYDLNATDVSGISQFWLNDTTNFEINATTGVLTDKSPLVGEYWIKIYVNDTSGNQNSTELKITVQKGDNGDAEISGFFMIPILTTIFLSMIIIGRIKFRKER